MKWLQIVIMMVSATGCVTGVATDPHGGVVVERSKQQPPAWIELSAGQLHETQDLLKYVELQSEHTDLPFGIKKTQSDALEASKVALNEHMRARILKLAAAQKLFETALPAEFDQMMLEITDEIHRQHAKIADIYFEKLQTELPVGPKQVTEYYRAQVLVHFPKERLVDLLKAVSHRMATSSHQGLQELGRVVHQSDVEEITH